MLNYMTLPLRGIKGQPRALNSSHPITSVELSVVNFPISNSHSPSPRPTGIYHFQNQ